MGAVAGQTCFTSLHGVDFKVMVPLPEGSQREWYSNKFKGSGLRYEVGLNIQTGDIVWTNGGHPCGLYTNLKLARESYVHSVGAGERTFADKGYKDKAYFIAPDAENQTLHKRLMSRHDVVQKRLKRFEILKRKYRHSLDKHPMVFRAVANLTQLMLQNEEPLVPVDN